MLNFIIPVLWVILPSFHRHLPCPKPCASLELAKAMEAQPLPLAPHSPGHK